MILLVRAISGLLGPRRFKYTQKTDKALHESTTLGRSGGLVGNVFSFVPDELGLISSLCVTLCFLSRGIRIATLKQGGPPIEYQPYGRKPIDCPGNNSLCCHQCKTGWSYLSHSRYRSPE